MNQSNLDSVPGSGVAQLPGAASAEAPLPMAYFCGRRSRQVEV